jgi:hypothetical protein
MQNITGVIRDWHMQKHTKDGEFHIFGLEVNPNTDSVIDIRTSPVLSVYKMHGVTFARTQNSIYVLV